ncbi:tape measure protein [Halomonas aquamarina]|uniref:Tape measure protein n=1 Tax=Vreelandella aquamarina TaxID=77097 RepID=A0ACC5VRY0_9GAMM|nr:tape measure protein [Halomonas aquamarina]MBZ5486893.1 tape measure protein [Halomonas aquamarina]
MSTEVGAIYYTVDARTQALLKAEKNVDVTSRRMEKRFDLTDRASRRMSSGFDHAGGAALRLRNIVTAVSSAMATRQIIAYSDAWGRAQNQLRQVTSSAADLRDINQKLMDVSNRSAMAFENTAGFYARVAQATRNLNIEQSELLEFVDLTSQSMRAYGTSAAGASALILQLSQAFNAGIIQGEEFNTIIDQAPLLLEALQRETGKGVRELKKMGSEGTLGIDMLIKSVRNYSDEINRRAAASTKTFADNLTVARNNMIEFVGSSDSAQGVVGKLGESVIYLSNNLETVTQGAVALSAVIAGRYATSLGAAAIANISLAGASIQRMQALRAEAQASNKAAAAKLQEVQASIAVTKSIMTEVEADRASLAAKLATTRAIGTQIAMKRELAAMDATLAQYKARYTALTQAETAATIQATVAHKANAGVLNATTRSAQLATGAMGGLRTAMAFLGGPVGVIALAAWALYSFREELGFVDPVADEADKALKELNETIKSGSDAALDSSYEALTLELQSIQLEAQAAMETLIMLERQERMQSGAHEGIASETRGRIATMNQEMADMWARMAEIEAARQKIDARRKEVASGGSSGSGEFTLPTQKSSDSEAKRLAREFDGVKRELSTQREQIEREYLRRNEVIRKATADGSDEQADLLRRSDRQRTRELQELTDQLASINAEGIDRINQQYDAQRRDILDISEAGSAEQLEALERNNQARQRALAEARRNELQGLISQTEAVDAEYEKQRRSILDHTRAGSAERQALMEQAERSFLEAKMQAQNDDLANIAQHNQRVRDLEAEHYSLMLQQIGGFSEAAANKLAEIRQATSRPMKTLTDNLQTAFVSLDDTISSAFVRGMSNGDSFNNILKGIGQTVLGSLLQSFIKLGVQMAINAVTQQAAGSAMTAAAIGQAAAVQAAWAPAALSASIATMGGATVTGAAAYSGALAANAAVGQVAQGGFMSQIGPGRLSGGPVSPGTIYPVTENGKPEVLTEGSRQYLLPGRGGNVTSNRDMQAMGGGGGNVTVNLIGQGADQAQVEQYQGVDGQQVIDILLADAYNNGPYRQALRNTRY